jgi:hypothetical protein
LAIRVLPPVSGMSVPALRLSTIKPHTKIRGLSNKKFS